ncbi:translocation/assembly module TamB domain-containing protein [Massilia glaciei]|uniref:Translocation and assembly module TamB C-terminal domain-containing protein n=1 Tax=Massilia glaciei TaxID=1524097 RepID=A0A2U2HM24_9BURK|nr:translocation/assembly module TamB domain-containing protein [Massilia glaciei]PWF48486.1 hypothetical protein C7C56_011665 [Massilia glaciei]
MDTTQETASGPAPRGPPRGARLRRAALWTLAGLGVLAVVLAGAALFALKTETGAVLAWRAAVRAAPGNLSGRVVGGTLDGGVALRDVVYRDDGLRIAVDRLEARWELLRSPLLLHVRFARAGRVDVTLPPGDDQPARLPARLTLPFALKLDRLSINTLSLLRDGRRDQFRGIVAHGRSDGSRHALVLERAATPYGNVATRLTLNGLAPYGVDGAAVLTTTHREQSYRVEATLGGTLRALDLRLRAEGGELDASAQVGLAPFADVALQHLRLEAARFDPRVVNPAWPAAQLSLRAELKPVKGPAAAGATGFPEVAGRLALTNARPGPFDTGRVPLAGATARISIGPSQTRLTDLEARLGAGGTVRGEAVFNTGGGGAAALRARKLDLRSLHSGLGHTRLDGPVRIELAEGVQHVRLALQQPSLGIEARLEANAARFALREGRLRAGRGEIALGGTLGRGARRPFSVSGKLAQFNPAAFAPALAAAGMAAKNIPPARINARFDAEGALAPALAALLRFNIDDSSYNGQPLRGGGVVSLAPGRLLSSDAQIVVAGNRARIRGGFGAASDKLAFDIDAPAIGRLGYGLAGAVDAQGTVAGPPGRPTIDATVKGRGLVFGNYRAAAVSAKIRAGGLAAAPGTPLLLALDAEGLRGPLAAIDSAFLRLEGSYGKHALDARLRGTLRKRPLQLRASATGALERRAQGPAWRGTITRFDSPGAPRVALLSPLEVTLAPGRIALGAAQMRVAGAAVALGGLVYSDAVVRSEGGFTGLDLGHVLDLRRQFTGRDAPFGTDLVVDGRWRLALAGRADGVIRLSRRSGDLRSRAGTALGVDALVVQARLDGRRVALDAKLDTRRFGSAAATGQIGLLPAGGRLAVLPASPVDGTLRVSLARLQTLGALAGPRVAVSGNAGAVVTAAGTLGRPRLYGVMTGEQIGLTLYDYGLRLRDGSLRLRLADGAVVLERAVFRGGDGTLRASGRFPLEPADAAPAVSVVADELQVLGGPNGTLTLSGKAGAVNRGGRMLVEGSFVVDRARLSLPAKTAPSLGDDVVVIRGGEIAPGGPSPPWAGPAGAFAPAIALRIGLGDDFHFEGSGADLHLAGQLLVTRAPAEQLQVRGTVRVLEGRYEAFGTELEIERGIISFQGPPGNPGINILATRAGRDVEAGVRLTGTVRQPRAQLVSEPPVSEAEALSRLVLGHSGEGDAGGLGAGAAQALGLGLLNRFVGTRAAEGLGLDELSIGGGTLGGGNDQVVNVGKEISERLYLAYEQSLSGSGSVLMLTYELSRLWSVVVFGGTVGGVEVLYDRHFDQLRPRRGGGARGQGLAASD